MKLKPGYVVVKIPDTDWPSMVIAVSGENCPVEIADDGSSRVVQMLPDDARVLIGTPMPGNLPWRQANEALLQQIGAPPKLEPGICIAAHLQALEQMRPLHPKDIRGTLRELGVLR